mmetsp:Transcript_4184/g.6678  ORF Transcript_4184/g.6678 Transcript_4184/m.6678 type:complete len:441 (+) Transcript_4184:89-1411(+)
MHHPFRFSFPLLDSEGTVVFDGYQSQGSGIYAANVAKGQGVTIAQTNGSSFVESFSFSSLASTATSKAGTVFLGTFSPKSSSSLSTGIFFSYRNSPQKLIMVAATLPAAEAFALPSSLHFTSLKDPTVDETNRIAFEGELSNNSTGIYLVSSPHTQPALVVDRSAKFPDGIGRLCFSNAALMSTTGSDSVVFFSSNCDGASADGEIKAALRNRNRMCRSRRSVDHTIKDTASNLDAGVFIATASSSSSSSSSSPSSSSPAFTVSVLADFQTEVPGSNSSEHFEAFGAPIAGSDIVAFVAETNLRLGIFAYHVATKKLSVVADTLTAVPGLTEGQFGDFPYAPSVFGTSCAFYGDAPGSASGIYVSQNVNFKGEDESESESRSNSISTIVTMASSFGTAAGGAFSFIGFGGNAYADDKISFYGVTTLDGIFMLPVPPKHHP